MAHHLHNHHQSVLLFILVIIIIIVSSARGSSSFIVSSTHNMCQHLSSLFRLLLWTAPMSLGDIWSHSRDIVLTQRYASQSVTYSISAIA